MRIFISYRRSTPDPATPEGERHHNPHGDKVRIALEKAGHQCWMDTASIAGGVFWEQAIYENVISCDVVVLILFKDTAGAEWVRRETSLARAFGVELLVLVIDLAEEDANAQIKDLNVSDRHYTKLAGDEDLDQSDTWNRALRDLDFLGQRTRQQRRPLLRQIVANTTYTPKKAVEKLNLAEIPLGGPAGARIILASGDMLQHKGMDVVVNSENDMLQMARYHEQRTVSGQIRLRGSEIFDNKKADSVQRQLNAIAPPLNRPVVMAGEVFVTSAGQPSSALFRLNGTRFIFHVVSVHADLAAGKIIPFAQEHNIDYAVMNCIQTAATLNRWSTSAANTLLPPALSARFLPRRLRRAPRSRGVHIENIIMPVFGTGQGGKSISEILPLMIDSTIAWWRNDRRRSVRRKSVDRQNAPKNIYISVFAEDDVDVCVSIFKKKKADLDAAEL